MTNLSQRRRSPLPVAAWVGLVLLGLGMVALTLTVVLAPRPDADADQPRTVVQWDNYPTPIREEIAYMEETKYCPGLFARYGIAQDEGGGEDLLEYLRESLSVAGCW